MSRDVIGGDAVVATPSTDGREWVQAADILLAGHRTLGRARRWLDSARHRHPGAVVVVSRQRGGRWCLVGLPRDVSVLVVGRRRWSAADAERIARVSYGAWLVQVREEA